MSDLERAQEWLGCERDEFLHLTRGERVPFCGTHGVIAPATWPCPEATRLAALLAETRAEGWDEGHSIGALDTANAQIWNHPPTPNPYRVKP